MPCNHPILITNPKKVTTMEDPSKIMVPCGTCLPCLSRKRSEWTFRLIEEEKISTSSTFLTLTYNQESIPISFYKPGYYNETLDKKDLQNYFKRVRRKTPNLKYYAVGEYGSRTERPHYHAIVFNANNDDLAEKWFTSDPRTKKKYPNGHVRTDRVSQASIHYVTKYVINKFEYAERKRQKEFACISKGLGRSYINPLTTHYHKEALESCVTFKGGNKTAMPRYYKDQIFDDEELQKISAQSKELQEQLLHEQWLYHDKWINKLKWEKRQFENNKSYKL